MFIINTSWLKTPGYLVLPVLIAVSLTRGLQLATACYWWRLGSECNINLPAPRYIASYQKAYPILQNNGFFMLSYAQAMVFKGMYTEAIPVLNKAMSVMPSAEGYTRLGDCYVQTGKICEAEDAFQYARYLIPTRAQPVLGLARLYLHTGREQEAVSMIDEYFKQKIRKQAPGTYAVEKQMQEILNQENRTQ